MLGRFPWLVRLEHEISSSELQAAFGRKVEKRQPVFVRNLAALLPLFDGRAARACRRAEGHDVLIHGLEHEPENGPLLGL